MQVVANIDSVLINPYTELTTQLGQVLALLQSYPRLSGAELVDKLEVDIRSIRRYVQRLQEMGLPIVGEAGPAGAQTACLA